jgi:hypothetical protein
MDSLFNVIVFSDLHLGHPKIDVNLMRKTFYEILLPRIRSSKPDMVVLNGDGTHFEIRSNSEAMSFYLEMMYMVAREKNKVGEPILFVLVDGTSTHEMNQLKAMEFLTKVPELNVRIIRTTSELEYNGRKMLFIPDEHVSDPVEHFAPFLEVPEGHYDFIFMHGVMDSFGGVIIGDEHAKLVKEKFRHIFPQEAMDRIVKYATYCGHVHSPAEIGKTIIVGSLTRFVHGEEAPKRFVEGTIDKNGIFRNESIINTFAPLYITLPVSDVLCDDLEKSKQNTLNLFRSMGLKSLRLFIPAIQAADPHVRSFADIMTNCGIVFKYEGNTKERTKNKDEKDVAEERDDLLSLITTTSDICVNMARYTLYKQAGEKITDDVRNPPEEKVKEYRKLLGIK